MIERGEGIINTGFGEALGFLTPFGRAWVPSPRSVRWFPVVGIALGLAVGGVWRGAGELWAPAVAAALAVAADLALTGMLHVDGLVDSADGLLPHLERDRRLEAMVEPTVGAFGVSAVAITLLLRWAALASMTADVWVIAGLWCLSRTIMAASLVVLPYARDHGLASAFRGSSGMAGTVFGAGGAAVLLGVGVGWPALAVMSVATAAGGVVLLLALRRLGGYTGDVLGAAGMVAETVGLLVAAARW